MIAQSTGRDASSAPTVAEVLAHTIAAHEAHAFGVVGNGNIHVVSELFRLGSPYTGMRHEAGAIAAADAFYRATGRVAVATTTYGPGLTNALTPLSEALAARIPLVYVVGVEPFLDATLRPRPIDINSLALLGALGVRVELAVPDTVHEVAEAAFAQAEALRQPVVIAVPHNLVDQPAENPGAGHRPETAAAAPFSQGEVEDVPAEPRAESAAREIVDALRAAERPLILVGRGVVDSGTAEGVQTIGDHFSALFATTAMARGAVDPQWSLGICGGFSHRGCLSTFHDADTVLVLGASMNPLQMRKGTIFNPDARIIRVDWDPSPDTSAIRVPAIPVTDVYSVPLEHVIPEILQLLTEVEAEGREVASPTKTWRQQLGQFPAAEDEALDPGCFAEQGADGRLDPRHVLRRLNALLPSERTVVTDGGHFLGWVPKYVECPDPRSTLLVGGAIMTIGLGLSSATGAAKARPERYTALLSGDGGAQMAWADLGPFLQAAAEGAGGTLIVMNDAAYGAEVHQYAPKGLEEAPMLLDDVNFADAGQAFGVAGLRVTEPEQLADGGEVERFLDEHAGQACILDVAISRVPVADFLKE